MIRWRHTSTPPPTAGAPTTAWHRLVRTRASRWSVRLLVVMAFIALFADFLANDKPIVARYEGDWYAPVVKQYLVDWQWSTWPPALQRAKWSELELDWAWWPPIRYTARTIDIGNSNFRSPFETQRLKSWQWTHWLGTDRIGRDVAAGMIAGTRIALAVGIIAMGIALLIGLSLGGIAGFFGDEHLQLRRSRIIGGLLLLPLGLFLGFIARHPFQQSDSVALYLLVGSLICLVAIYLGTHLTGFLNRFPWWAKRVGVPVDSLVMRLIELVNSVPSLLLLLAILAILPESNIFYVMVIIGLLGWTGIARFVRAELLRIRQLEYLEAARVLGFSNSRILFRHALPNALGPVWVSLSFGIAGAILAEAFLSFLGIGLPIETVSWGSLLQQSRDYLGAWWMAVFPGSAIFVTVFIFNLMGEALSRRG